MTTSRSGHLPAAAKRFLMWDTNGTAFGVSMPFPTPVELTHDETRRMVNALIDNHETLRSRYTSGPDAAWTIEPPSEGEIVSARVDVRTVDINGLDEAAVRALIEAETAVSNARLDPAAGRIVSAALFTSDAGSHLLLLTVHHVACDAVAMWLLWDDMDTYVRQWQAGEPIALTPEQTTTSEWAEFLETYALTRTGELDYWLGTSDSRPYSPTRPATPEAVYIDAVLEGPAAERLLTELPKAFEATYTRIMLVALALAVEDVLGEARSIQVQKHGRYARLRPGTDLGRTVGWLSDDYPWLPASIAGSDAARMRHAIAEYPRSPEDYTILRWYHPELMERFHTFNDPKFYFNFVGDIGAEVPTSRSRDLARLTMFDLSMLLGAYRADGVLKVHYSVHSPTGGLGWDTTNQIVTRWLSILETVDTDNAATGCPVTRVTTATGDSAWLATGYDLVRELFTDPRLGRSHPTPETAPRLSAAGFSGGPIGDFDNELAEHARMRELLQPHFSPRRMRELRPRVEKITGELLDAMAAHGSPADLQAALALPLPLLVICELLGVPYDDRDQFREWVDAVGNVADRAKVERGLGELFAYCLRLVGLKRRQPGDDVVSRLCAVADLGDDEIAQHAMVLLFAGHETSAVQIGVGVRMLLENPDQWQQLHANPHLVANAAEELLRACDASSLPRYARTDLEIADVAIPAGDLVLLGIRSANHDESVFTDPSRVDITRTEGAHFLFGYGPRYCLGAPLARIEMQAAFGQLVQRFPTMTLAVDPATLSERDEVFTGGLTALPVRW